MNEVEKPDLKAGIPLASIVDGGKLLGMVDGEDVLLVRRGTEWFAVGAHCTHYHARRSWWLAMKCDVRGTMPVSVCAPAKLYELLRSTPSSAGGLSR